jgi:acyl carrier protein
MDRQEIFSKFSNTFLDVLDLDHYDLTDATTAHDVAEWDSLSHIRLIVAVEREFGVKFANAEIESFKCVGDLIDAVANKLGQRR